MFYTNVLFHQWLGKTGVFPAFSFANHQLRFPVWIAKIWTISLLSFYSHLDFCHPDLAGLEPMELALWSIKEVELVSPQVGLFNSSLGPQKLHEDKIFGGGC